MPELPLKTPNLGAADLDNLRRRFLRVLLNHAKSLRLSQPLPESYFGGQEYVEDANRVNCTISIAFIYPALIKSVEFWHRKSRLVFRQIPPLLFIYIQRKISERLWDDLRLFSRGEQFIIGYLSRLMPVINRRLLDNRYLNGEPLSRTFSLLDAIGIRVTCGKYTVSLNWPISVVPFHRTVELAPGRTEMYLRDLVDAMQSFLSNDFDECVRRLVTSTETFFLHLGWKAATKPNTFRRILDCNVDTSGLAGQVIVQNLKFIYKVRNKIVHRGFRMSPSSGLFCDKAIGSATYLIQMHSGDETVSRYASSLRMQLLKAQGVLGGPFDLDEIEKRECSGNCNDCQPIQTATDFNRFIFNSLRITEQDMSSIL